MQKVENEIIDNIKSIFESLEKSVSWTTLMLLATYFVSKSGQKNIAISNIDIPKEISGIVLFGVLCAFNFKVLHLLQNLKQLLDILKPKTDVISMKIRLHRWSLNPFAETEGRLGILINNFGYAILLILWWFGAQLGFRLFEMSYPKVIYQIIGLILFSLYLIFGIISMIIILNLMPLICKNKTMIKIKMILTIIAIPIGAFGLRYLFF